MPAINIDELVEPIVVTVGGETYTVDDIPQDVAKRMNAIGAAAQKAEDAGEVEDDSTDQMAVLLAEILGAKPEAIAAIGMRKLLKLTTVLMTALTDEVTAKNVPEAAATKLQ